MNLRPLIPVLALVNVCACSFIAPFKKSGHLRSILVACALMISSIAGYAQSDTAYRSTLEKMFIVSGSEEMYKSAINQMFTMFKSQKDVPAEVWNDLEKEFLKTSMKELVDMLAPVYAKHLTRKDLEDLIQFYSTPVGKKFAQKSPVIMQESMQVGQQWGMKIASDFQTKLKEKGY